MKKFLLNLTFVAASALSFASASAEQFEVDGIYYDVNADNTTVTTVFNACYADSLSGNVVIPASVTNGTTTYSVTAIGNDTFCDCVKVTEFTIPNTVTSIGEYSFGWCNGISSITIPSSVKSIASGAFNNCTSLATIKIPSTVAIVASDAFSGTPWYDNWYSKQPIGMMYIGTAAIGYNGDPIGHMYFRESTTSISGSAFVGARMTYVNFTSKLYYIGEHAFTECKQIAELDFPDSLEEICQGAFNNCTKVASIKFGKSIAKIGNNAFENCTNVKKITITAEVPPVLDTNVFAGIDTNTCILDVPSSSIEAYKAADQWKDFLNITAINEVSADAQDSPAVYYNINGSKVTGELTPGVYIKHQGAKATKVIVQ